MKTHGADAGGSVNTRYTPMLTLLSNKTFLAGVAVGVIIGLTASRYLDKNQPAPVQSQGNGQNQGRGQNKSLPGDLISLAAKIGGIAYAGQIGRNMGMGFGRR